MSLFDDIQTVGSQLSGFFDETPGKEKTQPNIPNSINMQDVATYMNPNLALIEGAITGNVSSKNLEKYKEASGIRDMFALAASVAPSIGPNSKGFKTSGQTLTETYNKQKEAEQFSLETLNKSRAEIGTTGSLAPSKRQYSLESQKQDALIPEAFGVFDAVQMGFARVGSAVGIKNLESNMALSAREVLNRDILSTGASLYAGRPSKFLLEQIQKTMPIGSLEGDDIAYSKYSKLKEIFNNQISQQEGLYQNAGTKSKKSTFENNIGNLEHMVNRLDVVLGAFEKNGYGAEQFYETEGVFAGEFNQQDLDDLTNYFEE